MKAACVGVDDADELKQRIAEIVRDELGATNMPDVFVNAMVSLLQGTIGISDAVAMGMQGMFKP